MLNRDYEGQNCSIARALEVVDERLLERVLYGERPERYEYQLTQKGLDLNIALTALRQWGDDYLSEKPPRLQRRKVDKKPVVAAIVPKGTKSLRTDEIETAPGPGAAGSARRAG